jgi:tetratricopeptide (TPR) repeat protein
MTYISDLLRMLIFRESTLRIQSERRAYIRGVVAFAVGFLAYSLIRRTVYAALPEVMIEQDGFLNSVLHLDLAQTFLFLFLVYLPALIVLGNAISGDGLGISFSRGEYQSHISVLFPIWGLLFLITAPLQWAVPHFLIIGMFELSVGWCVRSILVIVYTFWAIRQLNHLSLAQTVAVCVLSCFTLPVYYLLVSYFYTLPLFVMIALFYMAYQWFRDYLSRRSNEREFQQHLKTLMLNPRDADAHYQLGLIHYKRRNLDAARRYFESALKIDSQDPDYHYYSGRVQEAAGAWTKALENYEETYRLNPEYGLGDICREVGKAYLNTGSTEKGMEFLGFFLKKRDSDPEGQYWMAVAYRKNGDIERMKSQANRILEQARTHPRFFRKENREWLFRSRNLIRDSRFEIHN